MNVAAAHRVLISLEKDGEMRRAEDLRLNYTLPYSGQKHIRGEVQDPAVVVMYRTILHEVVGRRQCASVPTCQHHARVAVARDFGVLDTAIAATGYVHSH